MPQQCACCRPRLTPPARVVSCPAAAKIEGVEIASWFGGSDATWAPLTNTYSLLRNFKLWRSDAGVASRSVTVPEPKPQSVLVEEILAGN